MQQTLETEFILFWRESQNTPVVSVLQGALRTITARCPCTGPDHTQSIIEGVVGLIDSCCHGTNTCLHAANIRHVTI